MPALFEPLTLRSVTFRNRIGVSPMCQYSSDDGFANDWHLVHLGSRAVGGAGLVLTEATAVTADGRISPRDLGLWSDAHIAMLARIATFLDAQGAVPGIQLAHAGRKASTAIPWAGEGPVGPADGGWSPIRAPSPIPFVDGWQVPRPLTVDEIAIVVDAFGAAARRAYDAGFRVLEIHAAHGYLLHEFLSPIANRRTDAYGGSFANRTRIVREVVEAVRREWPERYPLFLRISATDWLEGGWDVEQSVGLARLVRRLGVDLIDCSSGGIARGAKVPFAPGFQVPFAARLRREAEMATAAVGLITEPQQAAAIVAESQADLVLMGRQFLREPYFPMHAAQRLGDAGPWPRQYLRAKP